MAELDLQAMFRDMIEELVGDDGDLGLMDESLPGLTEFARAFASTDFACAMFPLPPTPPVIWSGVDGIAKAWEDYGESFENVRVRLVEIRESDTHTAVLVDQQATTRHGGVVISQPSAMVLAFDDDRVTRIEFHLDRDAALRSAGIGPG